MSISLDVSQFPWVITKFDGEQTLEELDAYIKKMDEVHARKKPYVGISWMKKHARGAEHRARITKWMKDCEAATRELCVAAGIISNSPIFRFLLSGIFLIRPMPCPYDVCATFEDAAKFVRGEAAKRRLQLPPLKNPWPDLAG